MESYRNEFEESCASGPILRPGYGAGRPYFFGTDGKRQDMPALSRLSELRHIQGLQRTRRFIYGFRQEAFEFMRYTVRAIGLENRTGSTCIRRTHDIFGRPLQK